MIKKLVVIGTLIGMIFAVFFFIDSRYALLEEVKKIEKRLDYKIVSDQVMSIQERIWRIEDRYPDSKSRPETVNEEYRNLNTSLELLKKKLDIIEKQD